MRHAFALVLTTSLLAGSAVLAQDYRPYSPAPQDRLQEQRAQERVQEQQRVQERAQEEQRAQRFQERDFHNWVRGERVPVELRDRDHIVWDYRANHLRRPPDGYVWIRDRDRFLLVGKRTGRIAELAQVR